MPKSRQDSDQEPGRGSRTVITVRPTSRRETLRQVESGLAVNEADSRPADKRTTPPTVAAPSPTAPAPVVRQRRGCMGTVALFGGLSLLVLTLALAIMMLAFTQQMTSFFDDPVDKVLEMFGIDRGNTEAEVVDTQLILLGIKDMAMLETTRGDILIEETVVQPKTFLLKDARLRVQYLGRVTAGIDLSQITEANILEQTDDRLVIQLPPAQITGCYLQYHDTLENTCGTNVLGMADCSATFERLNETAYERGMQDLLRTAEELAILDIAYDNAETAIAGLLRDLGFETIEFRHSDPLPITAENCRVGTPQTIPD